MFPCFASAITSTAKGAPEAKSTSSHNDPGCNNIPLNCVDGSFTQRKSDRGGAMWLPLW